MKRSAVRKVVVNSPMPANIHGTYSGAQAHRRRGFKPCKECALAEAKYVNEYRARKARERLESR